LLANRRSRQRAAVGTLLRAYAFYGQIFLWLKEQTAIRAKGKEYSKNEHVQETRYQYCEIAKTVVGISMCCNVQYCELYMRKKHTAWVDAKNVYAVKLCMQMITELAQNRIFVIDDLSWMTNLIRPVNL